MGLYGCLDCTAAFVHSIMQLLAYAIDINAVSHFALHHVGMASCCLPDCLD
jgi:hypothetical protein